MTQSNERTAQAKPRLRAVEDPVVPAPVAEEAAAAGTLLGNNPESNPETSPATDAAVSPETPAEAPAPTLSLQERRAARRARRAAREAAAAPQPTKAQRAAARAAALAEEDEDEDATRTEAPAVAVPHVLPARMQRRHVGVLISFGLMVLLPLVVSVFYLYVRAADEYHSEAAFSIRSESAAVGAAGILGTLTQMGSGTASDTDILFEFIRSQKIVEEIDPELDLRRIYNKVPSDVVFSLGKNPSIEALHDHWLNMVDVSLGSAGILHVEARAFDPEDARRITQAILDHSSALVNRLSNQARSDAISFASRELAQAEDNLRTIRQKLADFRHEHRLVDPAADVAGQSGLLNALQDQLAKAMVDRDMLTSYADGNDQRVLQANRRIDALTDRIDQERGSLEVEGVQGSLPDLVGAYEELKVDMEFASKAYVETLAGLSAARAQAEHQARYLAPHIQPTLATSSLYPHRGLIALMIGIFLLLGWGISMLIYYNVRDNR